MKIKTAKVKPFYRKCPHCSKRVRFMHYTYDISEIKINIAKNLEVGPPIVTMENEFVWIKRDCHEDDLAQIRGLCLGCMYEEDDGRMEWVDVCPNCYEAIR